MRLHSKIRASTSEPVKIVSKSATFATIARTFGDWFRLLWKY